VPGATTYFSAIAGAPYSGEVRFRGNVFMESNLTVVGDIQNSGSRMLVSSNMAFSQTLTDIYLENTASSGNMNFTGDGGGTLPGNVIFNGNSAEYIDWGAMTARGTNLIVAGMFTAGVFNTSTVQVNGTNGLTGQVLTATNGSGDVQMLYPQANYLTGTLPYGTLPGSLGAFSTNNLGAGTNLQSSNVVNNIFFKNLGFTPTVPNATYVLSGTNMLITNPVGWAQGSMITLLEVNVNGSAAFTNNNSGSSNILYTLPGYPQFTNSLPIGAANTTSNGFTLVYGGTNWP